MWIFPATSIVWEVLAYSFRHAVGLLAIPQHPKSIQILQWADAGNSVLPSSQSFSHGLIHRGERAPFFNN
jgi:hypothetical protein